MKPLTHRHSDRTRRLILKGAVASGLAGFGLAGYAGLAPTQAAADAAKWPKDAFQQKSEADAIKSLYGKSAEVSDKVKLDAPEIAENGAVVPIAITSTLSDVTSIAILVSENPFPLAAAYKFSGGTSGMVANRLKMAKTSQVVAVVEAGGKLYSASKEVKVTVGGCGG
jgi:sulfur-oxidizing protein SoxY